MNLNDSVSHRSEEAVRFAGDVIDDDPNSVWLGGECTIDGRAEKEDSAKRKVRRKARFTIRERQTRKKNQNKTAAEKYRRKKRSERENLSSRLKQLQDLNRELKNQKETLKFRLENLREIFDTIFQK